MLRIILAEEGPRCHKALINVLIALAMAMHRLIHLLVHVGHRAGHLGDHHLNGRWVECVRFVSLQG